MAICRLVGEDQYGVVTEDLGDFGSVISALKSPFSLFPKLSSCATFSKHHNHPLSSQLKSFCVCFRSHVLLLRDFPSVDIFIPPMLFPVLFFDDFFFLACTPRPFAKSGVSDFHTLLLFSFTLLIKVYIGHIPCL